MPGTNADGVVASAVVEDGMDCGWVCRETEGGAGEGEDAERAVIGRGSNDRRLALLAGR